ncbi:iron-containing redox enzyme family protein [Sphaerisporangium sp. TRM90804]|uniref:iron-containing redox enzyme family protein n=1 Tax=Sphaerisporangium sp. TRM90804 TaxID=3031113 RepID=UPI0024469C45|nr:iron-containing redox enzyme family protein [Sphaerisporangium sp. TRM90804]MDH2428331.1 iron-containing redox enzyme family protein [Sphaerisporangium sp. TRM90804]
MPTTDRSTVLTSPDHATVVDEVSSWLAIPADEVDRKFRHDRERVATAVRQMNTDALAGDPDAFYLQQLLLSRIYQTVMRIPEEPTAEGSVLVHEVTRLLERATITAEDRRIQPGTLESAPVEGRQYLSWLKDLVRGHRAFKHPYYTEFINRSARYEDLRTYVIQESVVDGRFDDFLAMMQVGTAGPAKMEVANNFWDEMGNGDPSQVHTRLFNLIYEVFDIREQDLEAAMTASDLLSGNLAVLLCRYRQLYPEAVGFLGMTEWLVPDRFRNVLRAWERLGLPDVGITYHRLHITIDSQHAAGWFHNIVLPAASSEYMRRGIARGTLWRVNSSARHLDERLANTWVAAQAAQPVAAE